MRPKKFVDINASKTDFLLWNISNFSVLNLNCYWWINKNFFIGFALFKIYISINSLVSKLVSISVQSQQKVVYFLDLLTLTFISNYYFCSLLKYVLHDLL